jgi:thiol-disulfide isomerase/thioredoxin
MVQIDSTAEFNSTVLGSRKPVMTMFYKEGCPACAVTEAVMGQLSAEYHGQVVFAKYPLANPLSIVKNRELRDKYNLVVWPTVILFFDGNERKRWTTNDFPAQEYENSIKEVLSIRRD